MLAFLGNLGTPEIILIVLVLLLLFGAKKLPELLRSMGEGVKEFRKASREILDDIENADGGRSRTRTTTRATPRPTPKTSAPEPEAPVDKADSQASEAAEEPVAASNGS